jgi:hypothetical protein
LSAATDLEPMQADCRVDRDDKRGKRGFSESGLTDTWSAVNRIAFNILGFISGDSTLKQVPSKSLVSSRRTICKISAHGAEACTIVA